MSKHLNDFNKILINLQNLDGKFLDGKKNHIVTKLTP